MDEIKDIPLPRDGRNFWMLPQAAEDGGYYNYGSPLNGAGQYCHPKMLDLLFAVGFKWRSLDDRRFGVGDISLADGIPDREHKSHRNGLQVDVRPLRKDGRNLPVTCRDAAYDPTGTAALIQCFFDTGQVSVIYFNDSTIPRVRYLERHDDHFHVEVRS